MALVFINYRLVDAMYGADAVAALLAEYLGRQQVFLDHDSMAPGDDYPTAIRSALSRCDALVAIIGPRWLTAADNDGVRLLDRQRDWVRDEIAEALARRVRVVPILLRDVPAPTAADLPGSIKGLARIQARPVPFRELGARVSELVDDLVRTIPALRAPLTDSDVPLSVAERMLVDGTAQSSTMEWTKFAVVDHEKVFGIGSIIEKIGRRLCNHDGDWIISIFGAGGVGKTTLAYETAKRYATSKEFQRAAWVSAKFTHLTSLGEIEKRRRTVIDWRDILVSIAQQLRLDIEPVASLIEQRLASALSELGKSERCLIVIDNLETIQDARMAIEYLRRESGIRPHKVVLTTRQSVMPYRELRWDGLDRDAAREYANYLGQDDPTLELDSIDLDEVVSASECIPLLIKLVVSLAIFERRSIRDVIAHIRNGGKSLGASIGSYLYAEALTSLEAKVGTATSVKIMNVFCGRTAGDYFTADEFYHLSRIPDRETFDLAKAAASQLALVRAFDGNTKFTIHSLLREFICTDAPEDGPRFHK